MKNYKTKYGVYAAWNYQSETDNLNAMSEKGWQLVRGGIFSSRFKRDENVQYRYQLDFQPKIDDRPRYVESFREFGWEYINSTFNGWHYFRKAYDPSLPEEEYEIFTDRSSLREMNGRWAKLAVALTAFSSIALALELVFMVIKPTLSTLLMTIAYAVLTAFLIRGIVIMKNPDRSKRSRADRVLVVLFLLLVFGGMIGSNILLGMRTNLNSSMQSEETNPISDRIEESVHWITVGVRYPDNYFIDVKVEADAPVTLTLVDGQGETVYSVSGSEISEDEVRLFLGKGEYEVYLSDFSGGALNVNFELD